MLCWSMGNVSFLKHVLFKRSEENTGVDRRLCHDCITVCLPACMSELFLVHM